jgi:prepilin-type processing-associated H-X9-DG protein
MATYTIIGSDLKQYGSVTAENICRWIAEGRLNEQSLIKVQGDAEFRPLPDFPEFAEALAAKAGVGVTPPSLPGVASVAPAKTSGLAIASLVLAILGVFTCGTTALIGLILGIIALVKVRNSRGALGGGGMALAGIIVSAIFVFMIPVFAAMVLPALASAKQKAQGINCISNVKQLSMAMQVYADKHQSHYPAATNWCDAIRADVGMAKVFQCPADPSGGRCSYAFNTRLSEAEVDKVDPNTVVIFEADGGWNISGGRELCLSKSRHRRAVVVGFADGHVESVPESRLTELRWEP